MSKYISRASLIISNCIPLFGVFFFGWDLYSLFILYWAETLIIGFFAVIKILIQCKDSKIFSALFFILHFGLFMMFHLVFIFQILSNSFGVITGDSPFPDLYIIYINEKHISYRGLL